MLFFRCNEVDDDVVTCETISKIFKSFKYFKISKDLKILSFRYHEHEVDDDVVSCETVQDEKCEDVTQGYTTEQKCTKWPREVCTQETKTVLKYSPETDCKKVPRDLCGPSGCVLQPGPEQCFDKKETVITEVNLNNYFNVCLSFILLRPSEKLISNPVGVTN